MSKDLATRTGTAVASLGDVSLKDRLPWQLLRANYSERGNITADRWRLLEMAFGGIDEQTLTAAVLSHMREKPGMFPNVGDIQQQLVAIMPYPVGAMYKLGYRLVNETPDRLYFASREGMETVICR